MRWRTVLFVLGCTPCVAARGQSAAEASRLSWMAGCWELRAASRTTQEQWMAPDGGVLLGASRTVVGGVMREYEFLRIVRVADTLRYVAMPGGQRETTFTAALVADTLVRFVNPTHDFPQQIEYRRRGPDSLVATISGTRGGATRAVPFPMRRIGCGG